MKMLKGGPNGTKRAVRILQSNTDGKDGKSARARRDSRSDNVDDVRLLTIEDVVL